MLWGGRASVAGCERGGGWTAGGAARLARDTVMVGQLASKLLTSWATCLVLQPEVSNRRSLDICAPPLLDRVLTTVQLSSVLTHCAGFCWLQVLQDSSCGDVWKLQLVELLLQDWLLLPHQAVQLLGMFDRCAADAFCCIVGLPCVRLAQHRVSDRHQHFA